MVQRIQECGRKAYAIGPAGFGSSAEMAAVLLPGEPGEGPMVLGFVYEPCEAIEAMTLVEALHNGSVQRCIKICDIRARKPRNGRRTRDCNAVSKKGKARALPLDPAGAVGPRPHFICSENGFGGGQRGLIHGFARSVQKTPAAQR
jgi:hypothetical protein